MDGPTAVVGAASAGLVSVTSDAMLVEEGVPALANAGKDGCSAGWVRGWLLIGREATKGRESIPFRIVCQILLAIIPSVCVCIVRLNLNFCQVQVGMLSLPIVTGYPALAAPVAFGTPPPLLIAVPEARFSK